MQELNLILNQGQRTLDLRPVGAKKEFLVTFYTWLSFLTEVTPVHQKPGLIKLSRPCYSFRLLNLSGH